MIEFAYEAIWSWTFIVGRFFKYFYLFIYLLFFWLCWVFVSVRGLSLVVASGGHFSSRCAGISLSRPLLLRSTGSRRAGSVVVAHGSSCSTACGIFPDWGSNRVPCIGRQILNHCTTREAPCCEIFNHSFIFSACDWSVHIFYFFLVQSWKAVPF